MKRLLTLFVLCASAGGAPAADLLAVYQRALQNDPQLREAEATRLAAIETKPQALAALLPQISGSGLVTREQDSGKSTLTQPLSSPPAPVILQTYPFDGRVVTTTHRYGVDVRQNLFRWENWVALQRADAQVAQAEADYQAAQQDLMERVAQRYFDVRAAQDGGAAAVIAAKRTLASTQELLREITGDAFDWLARPIEPFELAAPDPVSEDRWVDMALQQNLALVSSRLAADIARNNVSSARGGHFPSLDLVGSRYKMTTNGVDTFTDGTPAGGTALDQYQRTIGLQLTFPIYAGGMVSSQVRQAVYQHRAAKERVERVARQTEHDARDSYLGVLSEISRVKALRRAVESNTTALNATEAGYEAGTRTAVDVVESRRLWIQAQTDYSRSRYDYMINVLKLQQAAGILSVQSLNRLNTLLKE